MPSADFLDAHRRHWDDAELLFNSSRWANADQMYGFSAECGLKAVMKKLGMWVDATGTPARGHQKHVQHLWPIFLVFAAGRGGARWVPYLRRLPTQNPFANWSHHDRYAHRGWFAQSNVAPHQAAARTILNMVQSGAQAGLL